MKPRSYTNGNSSLDILLFYKKDNYDFDTAVKKDGGIPRPGRYGFYRVNPSKIMLRGGYRSSEGLYRSTIHEIAHFSMMSNHSLGMKGMLENYRDAYTRSVEWYFTNMRYCKGDLNSVCGISYQNGYVGLGQDLIDKNETMGGIWSSVRKDEVSGLKITEVEKAFFASKAFYDLNRYIWKNYKPGVNGRVYTEDGLNLLFDFWSGYL